MLTVLATVLLIYIFGSGVLSDQAVMITTYSILLILALTSRYHDQKIAERRARWKLEVKE